MADHVPSQQPGRKARDRSMVILLIGTALLMPPLAPAVLMEERVFGLPLPLLYIFVVWAGLIVCAVMNARALKEPLPPFPEAPDGKRPGAQDIPPVT